MSISARTPGEEKKSEPTPVKSPKKNFDNELLSIAHTILVTHARHAQEDKGGLTKPTFSLGGDQSSIQKNIGEFNKLSEAEAKFPDAEKNLKNITDTLDANMRASLKKLGDEGYPLQTSEWNKNAEKAKQDLLAIANDKSGEEKDFYNKKANELAALSSKILQEDLERAKRYTEYQRLQFETYLNAKANNLHLASWERIDVDEATKKKFAEQGDSGIRMYADLMEEGIYRRKKEDGTYSDKEEFLVSIDKNGKVTTHPLATTQAEFKRSMEARMDVIASRMGTSVTLDVPPQLNYTFEETKAMIDAATSRGLAIHLGDGIKQAILNNSKETGISGFLNRQVDKGGMWGGVCRFFGGNETATKLFDEIKKHNADIEAKAKLLDDKVGGDINQRLYDLDRTRHFQEKIDKLNNLTAQLQPGVTPTDEAKAVVEKAQQELNFLQPEFYINKISDKNPAIKECLQAMRDLTGAINNRITSDLKTDTDLVAKQMTIASMVDTAGSAVKRVFENASGAAIPTTGELTDEERKDLSDMVADKDYDRIKTTLVDFAELLGPLTPEEKTALEDAKGDPEPHSLLPALQTIVDNRKGDANFKDIHTVNALHNVCQEVRSVFTNTAKLDAFTSSVQEFQKAKGFEPMTPKV